MKKRKLGSLEVSTLGLGCMARINAELPPVVGRRYDEAGMAAVNL
jgi:aryl-alcohol dehydrogenase-like predicted oxidoreductase